MFRHCKTVAEVKQLYRQLAKQHHPDIGGDTATMQMVNAAYEKALKHLDGQTTQDAEGKEHTYYYNEELERRVMAKIHTLLSLRMAGVEINMVGTWLWINGDTKPHKELLKAESCFWHKTRGMWYWRDPSQQTNMRSRGDFADLAAKYGLKKYENEKQTALH